MMYGLLGKKLSHSFSKEIHEQLFDYSYELLELQENEIEGFFKAKNFKALNVTIPYKETVIPLLDVIDDTAKKIGAVNTVVNRDGLLYGYNTDFFGLKMLLCRANISLKDKKVLILGSGGTSKTALAVALDGGCSEALRVSRSAKDGAISYEEMYEKHADAEVIINTTPCGMYPNVFDSAIDISRFPSLCGVCDVIYNPLRSKLIIDAAGRGINATGGLYMLVAQAAKAAELFTGKTVPAEKIDKIYRDIKRKKENIVLIGMPGCGKSTIGKELAAALCKDFFDTDDEIEALALKSVPDIINEQGEPYFRDKEKEAVRLLSVRQSAVIATGGGTVLFRENIDALKQNGRIYFLDRPLEQLAFGASRPLSSDKEKLKQRYDERYSLYCDYCDKHIKAVPDLQKNVDAVKKDFLL